MQDVDEQKAASDAETIVPANELSDMRRRFTLITSEEPIPTNADDSLILTKATEPVNGIRI